MILMMDDTYLVIRYRVVDVIEDDMKWVDIKSDVKELSKWRLRTRNSRYLFGN